MIDDIKFVRCVNIISIGSAMPTVVLKEPKLCNLNVKTIAKTSKRCQNSFPPQNFVKNIKKMYEKLCRELNILRNRIRKRFGKINGKGEFGESRPKTRDTLWIAAHYHCTNDANLLDRICVLCTVPFFLPSIPLVHWRFLEFIWFSLEIRKQTEICYSAPVVLVSQC